MDARRTPKSVLFTNAMNEVSQFAIDLGPANQIAGLPAPTGPKPRSMPANDCLRADDGDGTCYTRGTTGTARRTRLGRCQINSASSGYSAAGRSADGEEQRPQPSSIRAIGSNSRDIPLEGLTGLPSALIMVRFYFPPQNHQDRVFVSHKGARRIDGTGEAPRHRRMFDFFFWVADAQCPQKHRSQSSSFPPMTQRCRPRGISTGETRGRDAPAAY